MQNSYQDRGLMKWAPFDALVGHSELIAKRRYELNKKDKPELLEDALEEMNRNLFEAFNLNKAISISYFKDGYFYETYGNIKKIDHLKKTILLTTYETFNVSDIISLVIL
ncbi:MAG: YolD-like family protein [Acholeplasma sp.]|nr:YolD-like family protein [Acholeplasma sp.]